jgi:hypothetical protein
MGSRTPMTPVNDRKDILPQNRQKKQNEQSDFLSNSQLDVPPFMRLIAKD